MSEPVDIMRVSMNNIILLVNYPTNIFYDTQAGGILCTHPNTEGFVIDLENFLDQDTRDIIYEFKEHEYGCCIFTKGKQLDEENEKEGEEARNKLGWALVTLFSKIQPSINKCTKIIRDLTFDFDRIDELQEGWWPVKIYIGEENVRTVDSHEKGEKITPMDFIYIERKGYLTKGNCD